MGSITYGHEISVEDYLSLRKAVGFKEYPMRQAAIGLQNTTHLVTAHDGEKTVAMARVLWDGGYAALLTDVAVHPDYQGKHIGGNMVNMILEYLRSQMQPGDKIMVSLEAAKGKEPFYSKLGFELRPCEHLGAGMSCWLTK
jgi:predicted N-acetyltransferase YhbS